MSFSGDTALLYVSLSQRVVIDSLEIKPPPVEFFVAFAGWISIESCLEWLLEDDRALMGVRIYTDCECLPNGQLVQIVNSFAPILLRGEAIAYARPAHECFRITDDAVAFSARHRLTGDLIELLMGDR